MKTKTHIFSEDPDSELWTYGQAKNLTLSEVEKIKQLLPVADRVLNLRFVEPSEYHYPQENSNLTIDVDEQIQNTDL